MFRTLYGKMYQKVLMEYGRYPNAKKQPLVQKMINSEFGYTGTTQTKRNRNHKLKSTMVKQAVYGIDGMTQVVLYFWPLLFLDEATIDDEIRNVLRPDLNFLAFMHLCRNRKNSFRNHSKVSMHTGNVLVYQRTWMSSRNSPISLVGNWISSHSYPNQW